MERDFMGLAVKQEIPDEIIDAAPVRSLPMQWSFSNKGSALPQLLSFQGAQFDQHKTGFDSLASTGLVTVTTEPFDSDHRSYPTSQKYTMTTYPTQHRLGQHSFVTPTSSPVVGTTDLRSSSKISNAPAQLTIFYNGSVCVYDNISPEKAQAIMLLAGNGPPIASNAPTPSVAPVQASIARSSVCEGFAIRPRRSSPIPVSPITVPQSASRSKNETIPTKPAGVIATSPVIAAEPFKAISPTGSVSAKFLSSGTVPQFRRKSLARFLEKRKERVTTASPYGDKQSPDLSNQVNSSGSYPVSAIN